MKGSVTEKCNVPFNKCFLEFSILHWQNVVNKLIGISQYGKWPQIFNSMINDDVLHEMEHQSRNLEVDVI